MHQAVKEQIIWERVSQFLKYIYLLFIDPEEKGKGDKEKN